MIRGSRPPEAPGSAALTGDLWYRVLEQVSPVGIARADRAGRVVGMNRRFAEITGLTGAGAGGDGWLGAVHPAHRERVSRAWIDSVFRRREFAAEVAFLRPDRNVRHALARWAPVRDDQGRVVGWVAALTDITECRVLEEVLRDRERQIAEVKAFARLGTWEYDMATRRASWSPEFYRIVGEDPAEHEPDSRERFAERVVPEDRDLWLAASSPGPDRRPETAIRVRVARPDGAVRTLLWRSALKAVDGSPGVVAGFVLDVTDYEEALASLLERSAELAHTRELSELKDRVLSLISHEIKTPLSLILGYAELLQDSPGDMMSVAGVIEGARRLTDQITRILDYAALTGGTLHLFPTDLGLTEVLQDACTLIRDSRKLEGRHVRIECDAPPGLPVVCADSRRLPQAVVELVDNAIDATPDGRSVGVQGRAAGGMAEIVVWDEGPGIAPPNGGRAAAGGLGIGLAIARAIVELHGGILSIASRPHGGTAVTIRLPVAAPQAS